jgi:hypothetical protein
MVVCNEPSARLSSIVSEKHCALQREHGRRKTIPSLPGERLVGSVRSDKNLLSDSRKSSATGKKNRRPRPACRIDDHHEAFLATRIPTQLRDIPADSVNPLPYREVHCGSLPDSPENRLKARVLSG